MPSDLLQQLTQATQGLLYPSETDVPFDAFLWPIPSPSQGPLLTAQQQLLTHIPRNQSIEEIPVPAFFSELADSPQSPQFNQLRQFLETHLSNLAIFRVGQVRIDIYLLGRTLTGDWAGLHTVSVET